MSGQSLPLKEYSTSDGLISNTIYDIIIDNEDYIWIGTDNGVARYNGEEFKHFNYPEGLPDNEVLKLFLDHQNRIWALCYNGRAVAIENDSVIPKIGLKELDKLGNPSFYLDGYENTQGQIFLTQWNNGAYLLDGDSVSHILKGEIINGYYEKDDETYCITKPDYKNQLDIWNLTNKTLDTVVIVNDLFNTKSYGETTESLYFYAEDSTNRKCKILQFDKQKSKFKHIEFKLDPLSGVIYMCAIDQKLYISSSIGLYEMDLNSYNVKKIHERQFTRITKDRQGNIWLGSIGKGLSVIEAKDFLKKTIAHGHIEQMAYDSQKNKIYYGSTNTMSEWDLNTNRIKTNKVEGQLRLYDIMVDNLDVYYCFNNKIIRTGQGQIVVKKFSSKKIIKDRYSDSLIVGSTFGVSKAKEIESVNIDKSFFEKNKKIRALALVQLGPDHLLVGSNDRLYHYINGAYKRDRLVETRVNDIHLDNNENAIVISETDGVLYTSPIGLQKLNHLFENPIGTITASSFQNDTLWLATNQGLYFITESNDEWQTKSYPFHFNTIDQKINDIIKIKNKLYLGTHQGILTFNPHLYQKDTFPALLKIKQIAINGKSVPIARTLNLQPNENNIIIALEVIKFLRSDIRYFYSLNDGLSWQSSNQAELVLANLSIDDYQIRIYAQELSGVKSNIISLDLHIPPPFYKSNRFYFLGFLALLFLTYGIYKMKINRVKEAAEIDRQLSSSRQKALRAQMNPHFLFNALNSIQQFFLEDNDLDGQEYISKFSRLVRNTLDHSEKDLQLINEELENLKRYVELEQLRLHNSFSYTAIVDPNINIFKTYIPSMILQPIVENSIWHGIQHRQDTDGKITLRIKRIEKNRLSICISDNGVGRSKSEEINKSRSHISQGTGLITQRLKAINGARNIDIQIETMDINPQGTIVTIKIPLINEYTYSR